ncbi:MAG: hypothetical protein G5700_05060 [Serratia symbiotica]|nr:hypothetical protein [Serratia symbiotica]
MLEKDVGDEMARRILRRFFPGGSAEKVIAHRRRTTGEISSDNAIHILADELVRQHGYDL